MRLRGMAMGMVLPVLIAGCPMENGASGGASFSATLSGASETPPVTTNATGTAELLLNSEGTQVAYELTVNGAENVTMAHIHMGAVGEAGPVVAFLFETPGAPVTVDMLSSQGVLTDDDLVGPLEGETIADLVAEMSAGNTYVNVHTSANENGEVRGQISAN